MGKLFRRPSHVRAAGLRTRRAARTGCASVSERLPRTPPRPAGRGSVTTGHGSDKDCRGRRRILAGTPAFGRPDEHSTE